MAIPLTEYVNGLPQVTSGISAAIGHILRARFPGDTPTIDFLERGDDFNSYATDVIRIRLSLSRDASRLMEHSTGDSGRYRLEVRCHVPPNVNLETLADLISARIVGEITRLPRPVVNFMEGTSSYIQAIRDLTSTRTVEQNAEMSMNLRTDRYSFPLETSREDYRRHIWESMIAAEPAISRGSPLPAFNGSNATSPARSEVTTQAAPRGLDQTIRPVDTTGSSSTSILGGTYFTNDYVDSMIKALCDRMRVETELRVVGSGYELESVTRVVFELSNGEELTAEHIGDSIDIGDLINE